MHISVAPNRVDDLLRFLRQMGYVPKEIDFGVVAVERGKRDGDSRLQLARHVHVWNAVNETEARIIAVSTPLEP
jgi:hypothetical protein